MLNQLISLFNKQRTRNLHEKGYQLVRKSKFILENPASELPMDLEYVIYHYVVTHSQSIKIEDIQFIEIGAYDGVNNDSLYQLIKKYHWKGILVEPQLEFYQQLKTNYGDQKNLIFKNVAISSKNETKTMYRITPGTPGLPEWAYQIASFNRDVLLSHRHTIANIEELIEKHDVECVTLETLVEQSGIDHVDILQIDTEGYDSEIIKMIDFKKINPSIIQYEHKHLSLEQQYETLQYLYSKNFKFKIIEGNTIAYRE